MEPQTASIDIARTLRRIAFATILALSLCGFAFLAWRVLAASWKRQVQQGRMARTQAAMHAVALASDMFHKDFGRWPSSFAELQRNDKERLYISGTAVDGWGTPIIYIRPTGTNSPELVSYGADATVDGDTNDGDFRMTLVATNVRKGGGLEKD